MLVYGDAAEPTTAAAVLARIAESLKAAECLDAGIERHAELVSAFIEAGGLAQGVADAEFARRGCDARSPAQDTAMALVLALADAVRRSWDTGFSALPLPFVEVAALDPAALPHSITIKRPEGYAFYALYPEAFAAAAQALARGARPIRVIGIRSIGTGLAAMAAAALGAPAPVTVRPVGHPFQRTVALAPALEDELLSDPDAVFAIVDEGPGLSGSSFGGVADFLEHGGVPASRIVFLPGHANSLGAEASPADRARWAAARRPVVEFHDLVLRAPSPVQRLETWLADLLGPLDSPLQEISGGRWREVRGLHADPPPVHHYQERRKFLVRTGGEAWLAKFAGLGREGARKRALGQALFETGFVPEPAGLRHGFWVERWIENARPLDLRADRSALLALLPRYLGFRARHFPAEAHEGASLAGLHEMARVNASEALGAEAAGALDRWTPHLPRLEVQAFRVRTDSRLHAWEWLVTDGRILKTDALDHHAAHDLVGCQSVAWDIAGAAVEFDLSEAEQAALAGAVGREAGRALDPALVAFCKLAYAAFQLGAWTMAADAHAGHNEEPRLRAIAQRYTAQLRRLLADSPEL